MVGHFKQYLVFYDQDRKLFNLARFGKYFGSVDTE